MRKKRLPTNAHDTLDYIVPADVEKKDMLDKNNMAIQALIEALKGDNDVRSL